MIPFSEAYKVVMSNVFRTKTEKVPLVESLWCILAEDVISDIDMPPFDKSAMDGYACRLEELKEELEILETIPAGYTPKKKITTGKCSKIMTGAMIPQGANCVIIVEETEIKRPGKVLFTGERAQFTKKNAKCNICFKAEDIKKGDCLIKKGIQIKPQHIAVLATAGYSKVTVSAQPSVGIITTGSELVEPGKKLSQSKIRNSNGHQLIAQVLNSGALPSYYGIVKDDEKAITDTITQALNDNDIVLISGGVSMGDYDFVPQCLKKNNIQILFDKVAVQPGKPVNFGIGKNKACFGMPGNPVSTFMQFELLVKPFLFAMMGSEFKPEIFLLPMGTSFKRHNTTRESIIPVELQDGKVYPLEYHGSAHINAIAQTSFVISIPQGVKEIEKGKFVNVRQIQ
ncbi:MAG TPA: hypothetical protein DD381_09895 [Lentisphaeria bacterium]|nr:MAG: hypothetical protein A2X47_09840 [Lentisphaerae bacterium GWF2_38_69]HBM16636.1 hypothetical protein [Lentisphaeria bacterium]